MREDVLEKLESLFPNGFILIYPNEKETNIRMRFVVDKDTDACMEMRKAVTAVKEKLTRVL